MRVTVPVRGYDVSRGDDIHEKCLKQFDLFREALPSFNNNPDLIKLLNFGDEKNSFLQKISFTFFDGNTAESISKIKTNHPFFHVDSVACFLQIDAELKKGDASLFSNAFCADYILKKLSLLLNLAFGTPIVFLNGVCYTSENLFAGKTQYSIHALDYVYDHADKLKWPYIISLSLTDVISFLISNDINFDSVSKNNINKAMNAFSHFFSVELFESDADQLFWGVLGIESLYAEGSNGILNQIRKKTKLILGEPTNFKNRLTKLYDYRSRFIHGDLDFPPKFSYEFEAFGYEYSEFVYFAFSILLASMRVLILNNQTSFLFTYNCTNVKKNLSRTNIT